MNELESKLDFIISPKSIWLEQPGIKTTNLINITFTYCKCNFKKT